jgi:hypothetical protein
MSATRAQSTCPERRHELGVGGGVELYPRRLSGALRRHRLRPYLTFETPRPQNPQERLTAPHGEQRVVAARPAACAVTRPPTGGRASSSRRLIRTPTRRRRRRQRRVARPPRPRRSGGGPMHLTLRRPPLGRCVVRIGTNLRIEESPAGRSRRDVTSIGAVESLTMCLSGFPDRTDAYIASNPRAVDH